MFSKNPPLRAIGLGIDVHTFVRLPNTRQMAQGSEISQAVGGYVVGLSEDVCGHGQNTKTSRDRGSGNLMLTDSVESPPRSYNLCGVPFKQVARLSEGICGDQHSRPGYRFAHPATLAELPGVSRRLTGPTITQIIFASAVVLNTRQEDQDGTSHESFDHPANRERSDREQRKG